MFISYLKIEGLRFNFSRMPTLQKYEVPIRTLHALDREWVPVHAHLRMTVDGHEKPSWRLAAMR